MVIIFCKTQSLRVFSVVFYLYLIVFLSLLYGVCICIHITYQIQYIICILCFVLFIHEMFMNISVYTQTSSGPPQMPQRYIIHYFVYKRITSRLYYIRTHLFIYIFLMLELANYWTFLLRYCIPDKRKLLEILKFKKNVFVKIVPT